MKQSNPYTTEEIPRNIIRKSEKLTKLLKLTKKDDIIDPNIHKTKSQMIKQKIIKQLFQKEKLITLKLNLVEKKNRLLTEVIDTDYLEILYRKKFMVGKSNEHIYKNN